MKDDRISADLERRIGSSLHAAAPLPAPDLADLVLQRTAATPQRGRSDVFGLASSLALAAAAVAIVVIGLQLGGLLGTDRDIGGEPSTAPTTPSASASAAPSASEPATPAPSPSPDGFPGALECTNEEFGFTVSYPADWWANEAVVPEDPALTPIPACRYFAEEPVELQPNAGLPRGIAVIVDLAEESAGGEPTAGVEVIERRETDVDGQAATVEEREWTEDTLFQRAGDRNYAYLISLGDGRTLSVSTDTYTSGADSDTYAQHREILDEMMESLDFSDS